MIHMIRNPLLCGNNEVKKVLPLLANVEHDPCVCQVHMEIFGLIFLLSAILQNALVSWYDFAGIKHEHLKKRITHQEILGYLVQ